MEFFWLQKVSPLQSMTPPCSFHITPTLEKTSSPSWKSSSCCTRCALPWPRSCLLGRHRAAALPYRCLAERQGPDRVWWIILRLYKLMNKLVSGKLSWILTEVPSLGIFVNDMCWVFLKRCWFIWLLDFLGPGSRKGLAPAWPSAVHCSGLVNSQMSRK